MSIRSEIERIKLNISSAYDTVQTKGGSMPEKTNIANLAQAIASIPEGGTSSDLEYEWWSPKMISDTTPEPYVVSADTKVNDLYPVFQAFDSNKNTAWISHNDISHWIQIDMGESKNVAIAGLSLFPQAGHLERFPLVFDIQGSNEGFVWKDILKVDEKNNPIQEGETSREYYFKESYYKYYKLYITDWNDKREGGEKTSLSEILFYRAIGSSYAVTSFNGRTGDILPQDGDYSAEKISFSSETLEATNVQEAIEKIANSGGGASTFSVKAPVGTIVIWSGSADNIPDGWHLCDGTDGTPNLKDKFILSAGSTYKVGSNGGAASRTLQASNIPTHNHNITLYHGTGTSVNTSTTNASGGVPEAKIGTNALTTTTTGVIGGPTNTTSSFSILPPYYALCYIMKITPDETDISADDVVFEPGETGLKATNIQEAIEEISKSCVCSKAQVKVAVIKGVITPEQYKEITGEDYT